jgi:hypothetical protein
MSDEGHVEWPEGHPGQQGRPSFPPPPPDPRFQQFPGVPQSDIPNHMTWAIIVTVVGFFTCWMVALPLGIVSIVFASQVDSKKRIGDLQGAQMASSKARSFAVAATVVAGIGLVFVVIYIAVVLSNPGYFGY